MISATFPAWVAARPDAEVSSLLARPQHRAHLAHALAEQHRGTTFGARSREAFIALLRPGGPDNPERLAFVGATLYRAWKLAIHSRVAQYLDVRYPGWRDPHRLNVLVPLGDGGRLDGMGRTPMPGPSPADASLLWYRLPVPALWVALWDRWVEPVDCSYSSLSAITYRGAAWRGLLQEDKGGPGIRAKLAALVELAAADVRPPLESSPVRSVTRWTAAQLLFLQAVSVTLDYAEAASDLAQTFAPTRRPEPWRAPRQRPASPQVRPGQDDRAPTPDELRRKDDLRLDELDDRLLVYSRAAERRHLPGAAASRYFSDADELHEWSLALRRCPDRDLRLDLTRRLVKPLAWRLRDLQLDDAAITDIMNSVQMLASDMTVLAPGETESLFWPVIAHLPTGRGGPFVANVLRSIAIQHSKVHRYLDAQMWLQWANNWLEVREEGQLYRTNEVEAIQLHEATQQVALQATGLHLRILEWLLCHPKYSTLAAHERPRALERLLSISTQALQYAGTAYTELERIQQNFKLPTTKIKERAATQAWVTNTRCMFMRALLLRAMLHLVEAGSEHLHPGARQEAEEQARHLRDFVPRLYAETTVDVLPANFVNELTRIALHYAFLTGQRFLPPGRPSALPEHLARPVPGSSHGSSRGRLDVLGASHHLIEQGHNAGILTSITYPPAREVLQRHSIPAEIREGAWRRMDVPPSYQEWLRDRDLAMRLSRRFAPAEFLRTTRLLVPQPVVSVPY
ncbi:hypothetical protein [Micromonospora sp. NPDC006431]|uniref:hypothetical protein n=1 Tax=Micromonospora sp. NPDC006431 TaxID=3364235 RepID=UPI0036AC02D8